MTHHKTARYLLAALICLVAPLAAQAQGRDDVEPGQPYIAETFTDWDLRCIRSPEDGIPERCEMFQLLRDEEDNAVVAVRFNVPFQPPEGQVAVGIFMTPIETLLAPGLRLQIDDGEVAGVPFTLCEASGCMARVAMSAEDIESFQNGGDAIIEIVALVRGSAGEIGGVPVNLTASLRGFTAAYEEMQARHAEVLAYLEEQQRAEGTE